LIKHHTRFANFALRHRKPLRLFILAVVIVQSMLVAFALRFEFVIPQEKLVLLFKGILLALAIKLPIFHLLKLDRGGWRYLEFSDIKAQFTGNFAASVTFTMAAYLWMGSAFPRSVYCIDLLVNFLITTSILFMIRVYKDPPETNHVANAKSILIYGAGVAGRALLRDIQSRPSIGYRVVGFLEDDPGKRQLQFSGVPVLGRGREAATIVERLRAKRIEIEEIVVAMPSADPRKRSEALANCRAAKVRCRTVPALVELLTGRVLAQIRDVSCADLLGREPVQLDLELIRSMISDKCVLITGGGGSIGSELCRQLARFRPAKMVVFDQAETDLYRIDGELTQNFPRLKVVSQMGTIRCFRQVCDVIEEHRVDSIFHAAAYKHVPIMETHPLEAAENNVLGTYHLVEAALMHRVSSFVMISSDKAVNPTNIMGLTKRVTELLVASMPKPRLGIGTKFVSVRFGNVLGSNGSVVPLFREQIAAGGPVTVTHPDMQRYFMTIPEAVQLVLEASTLGSGGEIFVLEMGKQVRIVELAENMIRLSGRDPAEIEIRFTGLRPGEKLFEEVRTSGEHILPTHHPKIKIFAGPAPARQDMVVWIQELEQLLARRDQKATLRHLASLVPEYTPSAHWGDVFSDFERAAYAACRGSG
jgi:FlaA1/EpsC-like NDP-sugar epimerase